MKKSMLVLVAVLTALFLATGSNAVAGGKTVWVGRDVNNNSVHWTCTNTTGDNWILKKNGSNYGSYETVSKSSDYIEVQAKGTKNFERLRLYSDKLTMNEKGSKFKFLTLAKGKWQK
jgi:hypothetical protein